MLQLESSRRASIIDGHEFASLDDDDKILKQHRESFSEGYFLAFLLGNVCYL